MFVCLRAFRSARHCQTTTGLVVRSSHRVQSLSANRSKQWHIYGVGVIEVHEVLVSEFNFFRRVAPVEAVLRREGCTLD